jgi:predicted metal-binding protein
MSQTVGSETKKSFSVLLCRDCCCGTDRKHPDFDHAAQRRELEDVVTSAGGKLHIVKCIDACSYSNVAVIRRPNGEKIWLGGLAQVEAHDELCRFLASDVFQPLTPLLAECSFEPTLESQTAETKCDSRRIPVHES